MSAILAMTQHFMMQYWPPSATRARRRIYSQELDRIRQKNADFLQRLTALEERQDSLVSAFERMVQTHD